MKSPRGRALGILVSWALFWAMIAALAHVGYIAVRYFALEKFTGAERDFIWMVPLGYLLTFAILALPAVVLVAMVPSSASLRIAAGVLGFFGILGIMLLFPQIHQAASAILAAGIAARTSSGVSRFQPRALRTGLTIGVGLALIGAATGLERRFSERLMIRALGPARADAPNVLLIILDTVRAANMSFLGYERETTPALGRLALRGVVFEQAYSTAPWTLPSHASLFTGRYGSQLNTDWEVPLDESQPTVAEVLAKHGYATAGFVANRRFAAWDSGLGRGFIHYDDSHITLEQVMLSTTFVQTTMMRSIARDHSLENVIRNLRRINLRNDRAPRSDVKAAEVVAADFLRWLPESRGRPFFAFLNFFDAHSPYPSPRRGRFSSNPRQTDLYDAAIFHIDSVLGALVDSLDALGKLSNTIVVITSDHGEGLGEHGLRAHGTSLYRTELHVPLVMIAPAGVPAGLRVDKPVSLRDVPATLFALANITGTRFPGVPLSEAWTPMGVPSTVISEVTKLIRMEPAIPASRGDMRSILDDSTHFIINGDGTEELYAWRIDPDERSNIASLARSRPIIAASRSRIDRELQAK